MTQRTTKRLKYLASPQNRKLSYSETDRAYIGLEDIEPWTGRVVPGERVEPEGTVSLYESGDILFGKLRPYLAKVHLAKESGACSTEALVLRVGKACDATYLKYVLLDPKRIDEINSSTFGAQMPRASWDFIGNCKIAVPDLATQKAIAAYLDRETVRIDQLIAKKERQVTLLDDQRAGVVRELVRTGLNSQHERIETGNHWFPIVPGGWQPHRMRYLFRATKRQGMPDLDVLSVYRDFGVILKSSRDDNINKTPEDLSSYQLVNPGDLVINKMKAWQGSLGISQIQGITSPDYLVYKPTTPMVGRFMHHFLRAQPMPSLFLTISNGIRTDQWRLEHAKFMDVVAWLPSLEEQADIAATIDARIVGVDKLIQSVSASIELLRQRRAALITAAVTGQLDIRENVPAVTTTPDRVKFRVIVGAEIIHRHQGNPKFGRVKLQKELYLAEAHLGIDGLQGNYLREAAGPLDRTLVEETERGVEAARFYRTRQPDGARTAVTYTPLSKAGQHKAELNALLGPKADALRNLITLLSDLDRRATEAVATLYAVWNDALIDGTTPDDAAIINGVLNEWHTEKGEKFTAVDLARWLGWMKRQHLTPRGQGPRTTHTTTRDLFA